MKKAAVNTLLVIGILLFLNLVSEQYYFRLDLTEDNEYTLDQTTKDILEDLEDPVTVKAYFSDNLPPDINKVQKYLQEYLVEYARLSNGNLVYEFINPNESDKLKRRAISNGIYPVMINIREENQIKQQQAFLGAILESGDQKEVIPLIQPGMALEYALSSAIKKITAIDKPSVGLVTGHGSATLTDLKEARSSLETLYDFTAFDLGNGQTVPKEHQTLALINPKDSLSKEILGQLDNFLARGGNLFLALNRVDADLKSLQGKSINIGIEKWLHEKGITINDDFIIDASCGSVGVVQGGGLFSYTVNVEFPYMPIIKNFADHPATKGMEAVILKFASSINYASNDTSKVFTPIAFTSEHSGSMKAPQTLNIQKKWSKGDFPNKNLVVAGVLEETHHNGNTSKMFIVADGDFPLSDPQSRQRINEDNINLMVNAIDWMSDENGLINLRGKGIKYRPIKELDATTKGFLKYLNFFLPILLVIIYGLIRMQRNKNRRIKRMLENY